MIVDTSALVAIIADEPEAARFRRALDQSGRATVSAATWVELATVLVRRFQAKPQPVLDLLIGVHKLDIIPLTTEQAAIATDAYATFGRGTRHRAKLNFGDCFAYALAKSTGEPLLFKGDDFNHTDLVLAPESVYPR